MLENYVLDKSIFSEKEQEQILIALQGIASTEGENADELLSKLSALFQIKWTDWIEVDFSDWNKNKADQIFAEVKKRFLTEESSPFLILVATVSIYHAL